MLHIINLGSFAHCFSLAFAFLFIVGSYVLFKNKSYEMQRAAVFLIALVNLAQHLFKSFVWPHLFEKGFGYTNTAYNVCAFLIIATPFILISKNRLLSEYICYIGTAGPALSLLFPTWFWGTNIASWDFLRFYFCHVLLVASSILPALYRHITFQIRDCWKIGLLFFLMLTLILANNTVFFVTVYGTEGLYARLANLNPLWTMTPPESELVTKIFSFFTPKLFLTGKDGHYTPIVWYFPTFFLIITLLAFLFGLQYELRNRKKAQTLRYIPAEKGGR